MPAQYLPQEHYKQVQCIEIQPTEAHPNSTCFNAQSHSAALSHECSLYSEDKSCKLRSKPQVEKHTVFRNQASSLRFSLVDGSTCTLYSDQPNHLEHLKTIVSLIEYADSLLTVPAPSMYCVTANEMQPPAKYACVDTLDLLDDSLHMTQSHQHSPLWSSAATENVHHTKSSDSLSKPEAGKYQCKGKCRTKFTVNDPLAPVLSCSCYEPSTNISVCCNKVTKVKHQQLVGNDIPQEDSCIYISELIPPYQSLPPCDLEALDSHLALELVRERGHQHIKSSQFPPCHHRGVFELQNELQER